MTFFSFKDDISHIKLIALFSFSPVPYIENIKGEENKRKELADFTPEEVSRELIYEHLKKLFMEICNWECFHRQLIGFNHSE